jgi:predicted nucleic acid-binding protein
MIVVGASVAIGWLDDADPHHTSATQMLLEHVGDDLVLHPVTLAEVLVGPTRAGKVEVARDLLLRAGFRADVPDVDQPVRLARMRVDSGLKLPDCCVLDVASFHGAPLATFDTRLADEARGRGIEVIAGA